MASQASREYRELSDGEVRLLDALLVNAPPERLTLPDGVIPRVRPMSDGGMGSLEFEPVERNPVFGSRASQVTFVDVDGVTVLASLLVSKAGNLMEVDMFKGDYSPLINIADHFEFVGDGGVVF